MLVFRGEGKPEFPEKTSRCREENQQTQPTFDGGLGNIEPGPHWWEASALTTAPSLHPKEMFMCQILNADMWNSLSISLHCTETTSPFKNVVRDFQSRGISSIVYFNLFIHLLIDNLQSKYYNYRKASGGLSMTLLQIIPMAVVFQLNCKK